MGSIGVDFMVVDIPSMMATMFLDLIERAMVDYELADAEKG